MITFKQFVIEDRDPFYHAATNSTTFFHGGARARLRDEGDHWYLDKVHTDPEHRGKGHAARAIQKALDHADKTHKKRVELWAIPDKDEDLPKLHNLYKKHGFKPSSPHPQTQHMVREELQPVEGTQKGSNPGGIHHDERGNKYYVKHYANDQQAKAETLAGKIYHHMGIHTLKPEMHGEKSVKTKWNEDVKPQHPSAYDKPSKKHAHQLGKMYHAAILTKNWDIAGLEHDNIVHNKKTGNLHAIDHGGAFHFRAQGAHKDYGEDIAEKKSLRGNGQASGHVFDSAFKHHPEAEHKGLEAVKKIDDKHVHHLFKTSGLKNWKELHSSFVKRKENLIKSYE